MRERPNITPLRRFVLSLPGPEPLVRSVTERKKKRPSASPGVKIFNGVVYNRNTDP